MKKLFLLLVALVMLLAAIPAQADGSDFIRFLPARGYISNIIQDGFYSQVMLTLQNNGTTYSDRDTGPIKYLVFPAPEGASPNDIETHYVHYLDTTNRVQYSYKLIKGTLEKYKENLINTDGILRDGPEGSVLYYRPYGSIDAAFSVPAYGEDTLLEITVTPDWFDSYKLSDETYGRLLIASIVPEILRIKKSLHAETYDTFWNTDAIRGIELPYFWDDEYATHVDFVKTPVRWASGTFTVMEVDKSSVKGVYVYGNEPKDCTSLEIKADYSPYALTCLNDGKEGTQKLTISNGNEWIIYYAEGSRMIYAARKINGPVRREDYNMGKDYYVSLEFSIKQMDFVTNTEEIIKVLDAFDPTIEDLFVPLYPEIVIPKY